jgi:glycosyltransferase involved in cell wall biosynthesis
LWKFNRVNPPIMPSVSVIMPCFNHARFLADSVRGILAQTHRNFELIIVDDRSADNSWEVISSLAKTDARIKTIRHERNLGASRSRNDGLRLSPGELIGFCDADDIWEPNKLEFQISLLEKNPGFDMTFCDAIIIDENGESAKRRFSEEFAPPKVVSGDFFSVLVRRNFINMQTVLMRRECLTTDGFFDEKIKWVEDWWYWINIARRHRILYCEQPLARYRVHSRSTGRTQMRGIHANRYKVLRRILRRYDDLPVRLRAEIFYNMGIELCALGRKRSGNRLLRKAVRLSLTDIRAIGFFGRSLMRATFFPMRPMIEKVA